MYYTEKEECRMAEKVLKYYQLKRKIIKKINDEEYKVGGLIPSERELMETYQMSRITVRKAIDDLVNEGYLFRVQGKGTFVKTDESYYDLFSLTSCTRDIQNKGMAATRRVLTKETLEADKMRQRRLGLSEGEKVFRMERVYYADGVPLNNTITYLPLALFPGLEEYDFENESLYAILEREYGVKITHAKRTIEAVLAHEEVAENLEVNEGEPLILFRSTTYGEVNGQERAIETFKCHYRTDTHQFYIDQVTTKQF